MSIALRNTAVRMTQSRLDIIETAAIIHDQTGHRMADIMQSETGFNTRSIDDTLECFYGILK